MKTYLTYLFLGLYLLTYSQNGEKGKGTNLISFYKKDLHFGFHISINNTDFRLHPIKNSLFPDTVIGGVKYGIKTIYTKAEPGFALGLISDFRLHQYVRLRFTPNISFASRQIEYKLQNDKRDSAKIFSKKVESTFLIFPVEIKLQSKRVQNFSAYIIGGVGYTLDLAAKRKGQGGGASLLDDAVKLKRDDYFYSAGAGTDFYLQYFKLGLELKLLSGTRNLLNKENNIFSNSLDKVNSHMVIFSITFEG